MPSVNEWRRSDNAPTGPMVQGWGSLMQQKEEGVNQTEYINQKVYDTVSPMIPPMQWSRSANAPTGPAVAGWDGLAQQ